MEVSIYNISGKETGRKIALVDEIFGITPNDHAIYLDVKQYLANQRQGTHKAKQRNEVHGSTRKLHKQKGTGGSRKGSIKNPLYRHGGRVFGPVPRDYSFKLNKKVKELARKSALSYKAVNSGITVVEDFTLNQPKTKEYIKILESLSALDKKTLLVLPEVNKNVVLSSRNLPKAKVILANQLNTYELMNADLLLISEGSLVKIEELLK
ncbi:50S ribosomal protein L4 [Cytophagaceae bacterium DM2B3-1]|uniref:Large ribosomal subunit protein uL4 n=1 Tax=Xanthocytophaga flava TaxID=3048013 RepID=A0ABT7CGA4_9BACT|nr:50S ribosomal protein L4 [Xanthocytophaga flavus]MDJ1466717.1 50S ribosomal protein L4 [Xanthocytophaga flavus]MDJ1492713.1 50S ribosomal protein L4 [Xanthocytophaga flavus]